ncbi:MAG: TnpV protein [Gemmatimonadales bacterium]
MTDYATMARDHWEQWLPDRYRQIPNPGEFFAEMGRRAELEIEDLALELAGPDEPGETYLQSVGRHNNARLRAREIVLPREVLLAPESATPEPESPDQGWTPTVEDPADPFWQSLREQT